MNILITNDDGIHAPGLWFLVEALQKLGRVTVVAPDREQSGVGASISLAKAIRMHRLTFSMADVETYTVEGTPGDAVILGLAHILKGASVDLVVSGVNQGHNTGTELLLSGTVGAALHALRRGIPAIAVSAGYQVPYTGGALFETGAKVAVALGRLMQEQAIPTHVLYNVNLPFCHPTELQGVLLAKNSQGLYSDEVREEDDGRGRKLYHLIFHRSKLDQAEGTELWALEHQYIAITLLDQQLAPQPPTELPEDFCERISAQAIEKKTTTLASKGTP